MSIPNQKHACGLSECIFLGLPGILDQQSHSAPSSAPLLRCLVSSLPPEPSHTHLISLSPSVRAWPPKSIASSYPNAGHDAVLSIASELTCDLATRLIYPTWQDRNGVPRSQADSGRMGCVFPLIHQRHSVCGRGAEPPTADADLFFGAHGDADVGRKSCRVQPRPGQGWCASFCLTAKRGPPT
jgi:hypothetical protein